MGIEKINQAPIRKRHNCNLNRLGINPNCKLNVTLSGATITIQNKL